MRTDKYMMAKAWMKQDQAPQAEALDTWNTLEAEFNEERKAMLMASAETDAIKEAMNKKFGSGTIKYGSEIKQPEMKTPQAIFEFSQRNPAAEGGRMGFYKGMSANKAKKKIKLKEPDTLTGFAGDRKLTKDQINALDPNYLGDFEGGDLERPKKVYKSGTSGNVLDDAIEIKNIIVNNKGNIFGLEELGEMAEIFGEGSRQGKKGNRPDIRKVKAALEVAKDNFPEIGNFKFVTDRYKIDGSQRKQLNMVVDTIKNYQNTKGSEKLANFLPENMGMLYKSLRETNPERGLYNKMYNFGSEQIKYITDRITYETGQVFKADDYKNLVKEVKDFRGSLASDVRQANRAVKMNADIKKLYDDKVIQKLITGDLNNKSKKEILERAVKVIGDDISVASRRLFMMAQSIAGTRPIEGIIEDPNLGKKIIDTQRIIGKAGNGYAFSGLVYDHYGKTIDNALNSPKGKSFLGYYQNKIKNALDKGLVPDEIFSVTASARRGMSPYAIFTQALDADVNSSIKGANLDSLLSTTHKNLQKVFQGRTYDKLNTADKKTVQELVSTFENAKKNVLKDLKPKVRDTIQLAEFDLKNPPSKSIANYDLYDKNLQKAFDKSFKDTGYSMKVTKDMKTQKELIKAIGCPNNKAGGGRIEFQDGLTCFDKGQKIINSAQVKSPAAQKNLAKLINGLAKTGTFARNALKFGVVPEALFVGAESIIRAGGDQTLDEGFKSAIGFYTDWTGKTNFKADARASQNLRNIGLDGTINIEMLNEMRDASEQVKKLESNQKNVLSVYDESLMGESEQDYKKRSDQQIEDAKKYLSTKYLTDSQKNFYTSQENEAKDIAGTRSPFQKFLGEARNKSENIRYENDPTGMQSDMFTLDPMSAKAKRDSVKNLPLRNQLSGSPGETAFMNLSQLPKGPRQGSEIDDLVTASNAQFKAQGVDTRVNSSVLKAIQDTKQNFKNMTMEEMIQAGLPMEAILGFNQPEVIKQKPMYDYAEGGITGLRSKYEYKK